MKKIGYLWLASIILLTGCSEQTQPDVAEAAEQETETPAIAPAYYENYVQNPQAVDDRLLQEKGQTVRDGKGEGELKKVNMETQTFSIGEIELTIREAKVLHMKPDYSLIDFYHSYTHDAEFDTVKVFVEIENTSDKPIHFAPVALLETDTKELKTWEDDIYLEELNGEIGAGETKKGNIGFILEKSDIESLAITTSDVFDKEEKKLSNAEKIELDF